MFTPRELSLERGWPGRIEGDRVMQLAAQTLQAFFTGGGSAREHAEYALEDVVLRAPVLHPPAVRDFMAFEQHVVTARRHRGADVPKEWYEIPVFYFSNPAAIFGPGEEVPYPEGTGELDYELECAAIIGAEGKIGGFTVLNDWSARDLQRTEMRVGLGPAKGKDFATSSSSRSRGSACSGMRSHDHGRGRPRRRACARRRRPSHAGHHLAHPWRAGRAQARESPARRRVQVPRRVQQDLCAAAGLGRGRVFVREPRAGGRARVGAARSEGDHPHSGGCARLEAR